MTVFEFAKINNLKILSKGDDKQITSGFCGDLLSWVMANAKENCAWFTVMGNINAVAVASLNGISCIILCEGAALNADAFEKAVQENITVLSSDLPVFNLSGLLYTQL